MKTLLFSAIALLLSFSFVNQVQSQIDIRGKIRDKVIQRADQKVDQGIDATLDATEEGVKDAANGDDTEKPAKETTKKKSNVKAESEESEVAQTEGAKKQPTFSSYSKFDFVAGEKVIFFEDFSQDAVADFPALWNTTGSGEVSTTNLYPGKWLSMKQNGEFMPEISIPLNENFTFECDLIFKDQNESGYDEQLQLAFIPTDNEWKLGESAKNGFIITLIDNRANARSTKDEQEFFASNDQDHTAFANGYNVLTRVSVWVQKQRLRLYLNDKKVLDLPRLLPPGMSCNKLVLIAPQGGGLNTLISNIRIAIGAPDTRNKLMTEGKLVSHGILFDVNSDKIKPESFGALKEIANVLSENAGVKVKIVGHTDSDGDDAKNLDLSKRRAASVKNELTKSFGIVSTRMETDGKGESQPLVTNNSPSNKAQNRRVEFIKL